MPHGGKQRIRRVGKIPINKTYAEEFVLSSELTGDERYIIANDPGGTLTFTLPDADFTSGPIFIKTVQNQAVTSANSDVIPIDSTTPGTAILPATAGKWALLVSNGTYWVIMASN